MLACTDVDYRPDGTAPHVPGEFYRRELPTLPKRVDQACRRAE
ncbi:hypothetical protein [Deinococcus sp.]|nr:hypothetical protein [Deinococcus sp.]